MTRWRSVRTTAWLGLLAMWLIVFAPLASQLLATTHARDDAFLQLCSASAKAGDTHGTSSHDTLAACGYCDLLADHIAVPTLPPPPLPIVFVVLTIAIVTIRTRFVPQGAFPSGRPRAPPPRSSVRP